MSPTKTSERLRQVSSRQNALLKKVRQAFTKHELTDEGECPVEGIKLIEEAIRSGLKVKAVVFSKSGSTRADRLLPQINSHAETIVVSDDIFRSVVDTESPQGVVALVNMPEWSLEELAPNGDELIAVCAGVQDPGNLGTIIRSAEAFGAAGIVLGEGTVSQFNSKVVRSSAGSLFRLPCVKSKLSSAMMILKARGLRLAGTSSHKGKALAEADFSGGIAIFVGSEGSGLPKDISSQIDEWVKIPHSEKVESLNAGVAASVILYEASRQRSSE
jgi:TrmH family RNA methyltransferase